jgi:hypothetical protein
MNRKEPTRGRLNRRGKIGSSRKTAIYSTLLPRKLPRTQNRETNANKTTSNREKLTRQSLSRMEAQATEKRCGRCKESPQQCSRCKYDDAMKALRKLKKETGVDNPRLARARYKITKPRASSVNRQALMATPTIRSSSAKVPANLSKVAPAAHAGGMLLVL